MLSRVEMLTSVAVLCTARKAGLKPVVAKIDSVPSGVIFSIVAAEIVDHIEIAVAVEGQADRAAQADRREGAEISAGRGKNLDRVRAVVRHIEIA